VVHSLTDQLPGILRHLEGIGPCFDAIYSGFLADEEQAEFVEKVFETFPDALRVVDPVLGDRGKLYRTMDGGMVSAIRRLSKKASLITPNVTEAAILLNKPPSCTPADDKEAEEWMIALAETGPGSVVMTGLCKDPGSEMTVGWAAQGKNGLFRHPRTAGDYHGGGDLFSAYILAELLYGDTLAGAARNAAAFVADCAAFTAERGVDGKEGLLFEGVLRSLYGAALDNHPPIR
jgi:pyridoxine kinase